MAEEREGRSLTGLLGMFRDNQGKNQQSQQATERFLSELQEEIRGGKSTGDLITDFTILKLGGSKKHEDYLRGLRDNLAANEGGLVLVEDRYTEITDEREPGMTYIMSPIREESFANLSLGKISKPYLVFDKSYSIKFKKEAEGLEELFSGLIKNSETSDFYIVVNPKVEISGRCNGQEGKLSITSMKEFEVLPEGRIPVNVLDLFFNELGHGFPWLGNRTSHGQHEIRQDAFGIYVGDEEVDEYFSKNKITQAKHPTFELDLYNNQLRRLIKDGKALEDYLKEKDEGIEKKRVERMGSLARELVNCNGGYLSLAREIHGDLKGKDFGAYLNIPCGKEGTKLGEIYRKMTLLLKEGLELKMHQHQKEITFPEQPGVKINVAELVIGLCGKYQIKVPE